MARLTTVTVTSEAPSRTGLADWLIQRGAAFPAVAVEHDAAGSRLLRAVADIAAGQVVVRVPRRLFITPELARTSPIGRRIFAADLDIPTSHAFLAAYLLHEKQRPASPLRPYLDSLPKAFPTAPLFFRREQLAALQGTLALAKLVRRKAVLFHDYKALRGAVPAFAETSLRDYFWARTVVVTRVFGVTLGGAATEALVPMADMMNHRRPPDVEWAYHEAEDAFLMTAVHDVAKGKEVHDSYGRKSNGRFFVHYGFAVPHNPDDEAEVRLALAREDPLFLAKSRMLRHTGGTEHVFRVCGRSRDEHSVRMFSFLRAACAREAEMARVGRLVDRDETVPPLSIQNEAAALAMLDSACAESLGRFATSLEADDALLEQGDLSVNLRNAILVRRGEKQVLAGYRRLAAEATPILQLPQSRFYEAALDDGMTEPLSTYLTDVAFALARSEKPRSPPRRGDF
jgi:histone-lysine N-methyltransferase SETD3